MYFISIIEVGQLGSTSRQQVRVLREKEIKAIAFSLLRLRCFNLDCREQPAALQRPSWLELRRRLVTADTAHCLPQL